MNNDNKSWIGLLDEDRLSEIEDTIPKKAASEIRHRIETHQSEIRTILSNRSSPPDKMTDESIWLHLADEIDTRSNRFLDLYSAHPNIINLDEDGKKNCRIYVCLYSLKKCGD